MFFVKQTKVQLNYQRHFNSLEIWIRQKWKFTLWELNSESTDIHKWEWRVTSRPPLTSTIHSTLAHLISLLLLLLLFQCNARHSATLTAHTSYTPRYYNAQIQYIIIVSTWLLGTRHSATVQSLYSQVLQWSDTIHYYCMNLIARHSATV